jgi:type I restriction enzyme M protein
MTISEILKDTNYKLTQFKTQHIKEIESLIFQKETKGKPTYFIKCLVRQKDTWIQKIKETRYDNKRTNNKISKKIL